MGVVLPSHSPPLTFNFLRTPRGLEVGLHLGDVLGLCLGLFLAEAKTVGREAFRSLVALILRMVGGVAVSEEAEFFCWGLVSMSLSLSMSLSMLPPATSRGEGGREGGRE